MAVSRDRNNKKPTQIVLLYHHDRSKERSRNSQPLFPWKGSIMSGGSSLSQPNNIASFTEKTEARGEKLRGQLSRPSHTL